MALKKGSSGSEVVNLHRMLMELGAMPTGAASDRFGEATEQREWYGQLAKRPGNYHALVWPVREHA
jgi:hypothetical protein